MQDGHTNTFFKKKNKKFATVVTVYFICVHVYIYRKGRKKRIIQNYEVKPMILDDADI